MRVKTYQPISFCLCKLYRFFFKNHHLILLQIVDVYHCKSALVYLADNNYKAAELLLQKWTNVKEIVMILNIPYKATIALQKQNLTLSDAFGIWLKIKLHLDSAVIKRLCATNLVNSLINALNFRQQTIINNPAMLGAIYLDPRYRTQILNDESIKQVAVQTLSNLWHRLNCFGERNETINNCSNESSGLNTSIDFDNIEILDAYLSRSYHVNRAEPSSTQTLSIEQELELFQPEIMKPSEIDILSFWESEKERNKNLHQLAMVIYAIPPSETQIERDFSALEFIFSQRRQQLSEEILESILAIHLNPDIFYDITNDKLKEIEESE